MRRTFAVLLTALLAYAALPPAAHAVGFNIAWDQCGAAGTLNRSFACNGSSDSSVFIVSFKAPPDIALFSSVEIVMDLRFSPSVPDWWRLRDQTGQTDQCRNGTLRATARFDDHVGCADVWGALGVGGIGTYRIGGPSPQADPGWIRFTMVFALPLGQEVPLAPDLEYFAARVRINHTKTTGPDSCSGCCQGADLRIVTLRVAQPLGSPGGSVLLYDPDPNRTITWQGGPGSGCVVPARRDTWGRVKTLYR